MLSERSLREQIARIIFEGAPPGRHDSDAMWERWETADSKSGDILALLDAARAEGGAASGLAAGTGTADRKPEPREAHEQADVEGLVEPIAFVHSIDMLRAGKDQVAYPRRMGTYTQPLYSADALLSLSRLLAERSREARTTEPTEVLGLLPVENAREYLAGWNGTNDLRVGPNMLAWALESMIAHHETAERRLEEVVGALEPFAKIADHLTQSAYGPAWGFNGGVIEHEDFRRARQALSAIQSGEGGISAAQGSGTDGAKLPPCQPESPASAAEAVSQEGR